MNKWVIIISVILVLVISAGGGFMYMKKNKTVTPTPVNTFTTTSVVIPQTTVPTTTSDPVKEVLLALSTTTTPIGTPKEGFGNIEMFKNFTDDENNKIREIVNKYLPTKYSSKLKCLAITKGALECLLNQYAFDPQVDIHVVTSLVLAVMLIAEPGMMTYVNDNHIIINENPNPFGKQVVTLEDIKKELQKKLDWFLKDSKNYPGDIDCPCETPVPTK